MFGDEVKKLLLQVIGSWQVVVVTVVLVIYVFIVNYAARTHHKTHWSRPAAKKNKTREAIPEALVSSETDELGLEEATPKKK